MATESNENLAALEQRLNTLRAELHENLRLMKKRAGRVGVLMTLLVLIVAGYWSYIYVRTSDINADVAADLAYRSTLEYVNNAPPSVSKALRDQAPGVFDYAEVQILAAPAKVAASIRDSAIHHTQLVLDQAEPRINQVLVDAITHAKTATEKAGFDGKDPAQLDKITGVIADQIRTDVKTSLDQVYNEYVRQAQDAVAYLEKVAAGKDLDPRQQHLRQVIVSFLAVAEKRKTMQ